MLIYLTNAYLTKRLNSTKKISYVIEIRLIKAFIFYCYQKGYIGKDIYLAFPDKFTSTDDKEIPSAYTSDEIKTLLDDSKNYLRKDNHLRNYAILCLIAYSITNRRLFRSIFLDFRAKAFEIVVLTVPFGQI